MKAFFEGLYLAFMNSCGFMEKILHPVIDCLKEQRKLFFLPGFGAAPQSKIKRPYLKESGKVKISVYPYDVMNQSLSETIFLRMDNSIIRFFSQSKLLIISSNSSF